LLNEVSTESVIANENKILSFKTAFRTNPEEFGVKLAWSAEVTKYPNVL
jgi:hypothetical protein